jgi:hypothetical protein
MKPSEVNELKLGTPVWVWIVRFGKARWWPGIVEGIEMANGLPDINVRTEPLTLARHRTDPPVTVGFVTAPMRRLERRDITENGSDRPRFVPISRLRKPEIPAPAQGVLRLVQADSRVSSESIGAIGARDHSLEEGSHGSQTMSALFA